MDSSEPTYIGITIHHDRAAYENVKGTISSMSSSSITNGPVYQQQKVPETIYYEGTLVIRSGTYEC